MNFTEKEFLEHKDILEYFIPSITKDKWQTLFWDNAGPYYRQGGYFTVWCALLTPGAAEKSLENNDLTFDLDFCSSGPSIKKRYLNDKAPENYYEPSHSKPIRPFVLCGYDERLCEEFRLFHGCKLNSKHDCLVVKDESGDLINIAKFNKNKIQVHLKYIKEFLAISQLHLVININSIRYSSNDMPYPKKEPQITSGRKGRFRWEQSIAEVSHIMGNEDKWCACFRGKEIIPPPPSADKRRDKIKFIIGTDDNGEDILSGCNIKIVGECFYLKKVQFKKQVLDKYYDEPEKYSVEDGCVRCHPHWLLRTDNDHTDKIFVFLGDLYHLPYVEMLHWKSFNVSVEGSISRSNFLRSFECVPANAKVADLKFRRIYPLFNKSWKNTRGFYFFRELSELDSALLDTLNIPSVNSQKVFDEQVLTLAKLLIDSINVTELNKRFGPFEAATKPIQKLETAYPETTDFADFLRRLHAIRSSGAAHTKGKKYQTALKNLNISTNNKIQSFELLLCLANHHMESLI